MRNKESLPVKTLKCLLAVVFLIPLYIMFNYAFKSAQDIARYGVALKGGFTLINFYNALTQSNLVKAFINSLTSVVFMTAICIVSSCMAAYVISRNDHRKLYNAVYYIFLAAIILPFQVIMLPMYRMLRAIGLMNTIPGYILAMTALQLGYTVFIITGFIKTIPRELDEAAYVDGANRYHTFFMIIMPLLKPIVMTALILDGLALWNDLLTAMIILQKQSIHTLTLEQYSFISQFSTDLGKAFAAFMMSIIPIIILYFSTQKYIVSSIVSGAIKG